MTDTIGFPDDIPRWLVTSFRGTLEVIDAADLLVLVIDADQTDKEVERKVSTSFDTLRQDHPPIVPVLNKIDRVSQHDVRRRSAILDDIVGSPIQISAIEATGCDPRADAICDDLPPPRRRGIRPSSR